ncbi:MAG: ADP-ribosylation factor-like protein [Promethearchaeota archaeon]
MSITKTFDELLTNLLTADEDIKGIAVVLTNGLVVASKLRDEHTDEDLLAATTAVFDTFIKRVKKDFGAAENFINIMTVDDNKFLFAASGEHSILSIVANPNSDDKRLKVYGGYIAQKVPHVINRDPIDLSIPQAIHLLANARSSSFPQGKFMKKVIFLGDGKVGKSSIIRRYVENLFQEYYLPTIGINITEKELKVNENCIVEFKIWEMESQSHKFSPLRGRYYSDTALAFIIFDLSRRETFENLSKWISMLSEMFNEEIPFIILGNKSDLTPQEISAEEILQKQSEINSIIFSVSAKTKQNIEEAFTFAAHRIFNVI